MILGSIMLLSSLLVFCILLLQVFLLLQNWKRHQHTCRTASLRAQNHILQGFRELQSLNPQAERLRRQRRIAQRNVKLAPDPYTKAAAKAYLVSVITRQVILARKQKSIIRQSQWKARSELLVKKLVLKQARVPFALQAVPPLSLTPNYVAPPAGLAQLQKMEVVWQNSNPRSFLKGQCGSTIVTEGLRFKIKLLFRAAYS